MVETKSRCFNCTSHKSYYKPLESLTPSFLNASLDPNFSHCKQPPKVSWYLPKIPLFFVQNKPHFLPKLPQPFDQTTLALKPTLGPIKGLITCACKIWFKKTILQITHPSFIPMLAQIQLHFHLKLTLHRSRTSLIFTLTCPCFVPKAFRWFNVSSGYMVRGYA